MRSFRNRLRHAALLVAPSVALGCGPSTPQYSPGGGAVAGGGNNGGAGATTDGGSGTGATSGGSGGSGGASGTTGSIPTNPCASTTCTCSLLGVTVSSMPTAAFPDGGLPLSYCTSICMDPAGVSGFEVLSCAVISTCQSGVDAGMSGPVCIDCRVKDCAPPGSGRAPEGLVRPALGRPPGLGRHWALAAHLEAASVIALRRMAAELETYRAPSHLVEWAMAAADDEVHHAAWCSDLAERAGEPALPVQVARFRDRSFRAFALENAVTGCVEETWGAAVARWQSLRATDPEVRQVLCQIADDEAGHAELAWSVAAWADARLGPSDVARLAARRRGAQQGLVATAALTPAEATAIGFPDPRSQRRLLASLEQQVW